MQITFFTAPALRIPIAECGPYSEIENPCPCAVIPFMTEPPVQELPPLLELQNWLPQYEIQPVSEGVRHCYVAEQTALARPVVIELIPESADPAVQTLVLERLRGRARVVHPSLEAVLDLGHLPSGHILLITERAEGRSLAALVESREIRPRTAYPLALQLCEALQLLHEQGISHGHVSPESVIITHDQRLKLTGAGLGMDESSGQASWQAPFAGSRERDVLALGFTLHCMFARCAPEAGGRISRDLPPAFAAVLHRCLGGDVSRPLTTAAEVALALTAALKQEQDRNGGASVFNPPTSRSVLRPGAAAPARGKPQAKVSAGPSSPDLPAPPPPPRPQPVIRQSQPPGFFQRMDAFVWRAFSTSLHLFISFASIACVILLVLFKDRIVIEHDVLEPGSAPVSGSSSSAGEIVEIGQVGADRLTEAPDVLGGLPPAPMLGTAAEPASPVAMTDSATAEPEEAAPAPAPAVLPAEEVRRQYVSAVQEAANHALTTLRMDDLPHLQKELQLLQNGGEVPLTDSPDEPAILRSLRARYREALAGITAVPSPS